MAANIQEDQEVIYPTVLVEINGIRTHTLLDMGAGSSYASAKLIDALKKKPKQVKTRRVDMKDHESRNICSCPFSTGWKVQ